MRLLPSGDRAVLAEFADAHARRRFDAALRADPALGTVEQVAAQTTVLVEFESPAALASGLAHLRGLVEVEPTDAAASNPVTIPVVYDGSDLPAVADHLGIDVRHVIRRHADQLWTVDFVGFLPGFGYLVGDAGGLEVPRLPSPRTRVPAGAVGLAGPFSGIYPRASPGGWRLIGSTTTSVWDMRRTPAALLSPGTRVRFIPVGGDR